MKRPPTAAASRKFAVCTVVQATEFAFRRRVQATKPPNAITRPGSPAPTMGPGTAEASVKVPLMVAELLPPSGDEKLEKSTPPTWKPVKANT
jgi:hypothetical protein